MVCVMHRFHRIGEINAAGIEILEPVDGVGIGIDRPGLQFQVGTGGLRDVTQPADDDIPAPIRRMEGRCERVMAVVAAAHGWIRGRGLPGRNLHDGVAEEGRLQSLGLSRLKVLEGASSATMTLSAFLRVGMTATSTLFTEPLSIQPFQVDRFAVTFQVPVPLVTVMRVELLLEVLIAILYSSNLLLGDPIRFVRAKEVVLRVVAIQSDQNGRADIRRVSRLATHSETPRRMESEGKDVGVIDKRYIVDRDGNGGGVLRAGHAIDHLVITGVDCGEYRRNTTCSCGIHYMPSQTGGYER